MPANPAQEPDPKLACNQNDEAAAIMIAQKMARRRLCDVPIPVSALSTVALTENGTVGWQELSRKIPDLSAEKFFGDSTATGIRGLATTFPKNSLCRRPPGVPRLDRHRIAAEFAQMVAAVNFASYTPLCTPSGILAI